MPALRAVPSLGLDDEEDGPHRYYGIANSRARFCGALTGGRTATRLGSHRYLRAARRLCLAEHSSGVGITAGSGIGSDLAATIPRPPQLLPRWVGSLR